MGGRMSHSLTQRLLIGGACAFALFMTILYSHHAFFKPIFVLLTLAVMAAALREYYQLARHKGFSPSEGSAIAISAIYALMTVLSAHHKAWEMAPNVTLLFLFLVLFLIFFRQQESALGNMAITLFGIIYLTIPLSCVLSINYFFPENAKEEGRLFLAYVLLVTKMTDIAAYFSGKLWGKVKLAPLISPKKTIEGAIGGIVGAVVSSALFQLLASYSAFPLSFFQALTLGFGIAILAELGDLSESLLKRDAGVKNSSHLPGLGGVLDMVDSLIFTLPFIYLFLKIRFG